MTVIYILIALSLTAAIGFLIAFLWAVRSGQYDDTHTPGMRVLFEDTKKTSQTVQTSQTPRLTGIGLENGGQANKAPESKANAPNH